MQKIQCMSSCYPLQAAVKPAQQAFHSYQSRRDYVTKSNRKHFIEPIFIIETGFAALGVASTMYCETQGSQ